MSAADELADPIGPLLEIAANGAYLALQAAGALAYRAVEAGPAIAKVTLDPGPGLHHLVLETRAGGGAAALVATEFPAESGTVPVPARQTLDRRDQGVARDKAGSDLNEDRSCGQILDLDDRSPRLG